MSKNKNKKVNRAVDQADQAVEVLEKSGELEKLTKAFSAGYTESKVKVQVNRHPMTKLPSYRTPGAAGMDVHANITFQKVIRPGETVLIPTGLKVVIPKGYCLEVYPRSGLALGKGITVLNSPGLIDEDYYDEIGVILINHGTEQFLVNRQDRIAQLRLKKVEIIEWLEIDNNEFTETVEKERTTRSGGFGSTGI